MSSKDKVDKPNCSADVLQFTNILCPDCLESFEDIKRKEKKLSSFQPIMDNVCY